MSLKTNKKEIATIIIYKQTNAMTKLEKQELIDIKGITDEETQIANALKNFSDKITYPLLDVGSWSWKISDLAFPDKEVIQLDSLNFSNEDFQLSKNHTRINGDFFEFDAKQKVRSMLFCHSLQYIDDNWIENVIKKIKEMNPEYILLVINNNDWILWEILAFFEKNNRVENWEKHFTEFPWKNFILQEKTEITGIFSCKDISEVSSIICKLLLDTIISKEQHKEITSFLEKKEIDKDFSVNQTIFLYKNNTESNG